MKSVGISVEVGRGGGADSKAWHWLPFALHSLPAMNVVTGTLKALVCVALGSILTFQVSATESLKGESVEDLLTFRLPTVREMLLYDMHGNADDVLRELMNRRFEATAAICQHLERSNLADGYIEALFDVLAVVKDPAAIPWLEKQWSKNPGRMAEMWLERRWHGYPSGASHAELKWLTGADEWAAFFRRKAAEEPEHQYRVKLLRVLAGWFHDEKTIEFFADLEKSCQGGETLLIAQLYLLNHKREFDAKRTAEAVSELSHSPANTNLLLEYATELRDAAFVPWLVSIAGRAPEELDLRYSWLNPQSVLEQITFRRGIDKPDQWQKWFQLHGADGRKAWIAQAMAEFQKVLKRNSANAKAILRDNAQAWGDPALLPYVRDLLPHTELHNELVAWISQSYRPYRRPELQEVADQIISKSGKSLEKWAVNALKWHDFLPDKKKTWADWIASLNSAI